MDMFKQLVSMPNVHLAFVTGRHRELVEHAIEEYGLPHPDYVVADVGTTVYKIHSGDWTEMEQWGRQISPAWVGMSRDEIHDLLKDISGLRLQEQKKQNRFKLSYYVSIECNKDELECEIISLLSSKSIKATLVWSIDSVLSIGLLDILPAAATKQHAIEFLMGELGFGINNTVFSGDSGNDISVLASAIKSILVANASEEVRQEVIREAEAGGNADAVYLAKGGFDGMNGNYSAGSLEGVVHYLPQYESLLRS
jgi:HAD superfamily hydrolase (TIGR01484 family)